MSFSAVFFASLLLANCSVVSRHDDANGIVRAVVLKVTCAPQAKPDAVMAEVKNAIKAADAVDPWAVKFLSCEGVPAAVAAKVRDYAAMPSHGWNSARVRFAESSQLADAIRQLTTFTPRCVSLDGTWQFRREIVVAPDGTEQKGDADWSSVTVPHDWSIRSPFIPTAATSSGKLPWQGTGRYRRTFTLSAADIQTCRDGGALYLAFDGAMARPEVFVNGTKAGGWDYGYMSFTVNATRFVHEGENTLEVFCDTRPHRSRWYPGGGLYRSVRMKIMPRDHVVPDTIAIVTESLCATNAHMRVNYTSSLRGPQEYFFDVPHPRRWDVNDPYLYELTLLGERFRYGIREIKWKPNDGFHLNGQRVQLKGVDLHADMGPLGMAFDRSVMRRQLRIMKDMGVNALRTSHNAPDPAVLDLCDEMGIVVWNECFDKWDARAGRLPEENLEEFVGHNLVAFVRRDRNHPSVVAWSMSNEINAGNAFSTAGLTRGRCKLFRKLMQAEDATRPIGCGNVSHGCEPRLLSSDILEDLDITGWNYGASYRGPHAKWPKMAVVYTESASAVSSFGAYENPPANGKQAWPTELLGDISAYDHNCGPDIPDVEFDRMEKDRYCAGEFVWTGIDYLGEPYPYTESMLGKTRNLPPEQLARSSYYGICDLNGFPKDRYWLYRSVWNPRETTIHILPHWNWAGKEGKNVPVYVYTNGDSAELFLNGRSLGKRRKGVIQKADPTKDDFRKNPYYEICDWYRLRWLDVPYEPGELKVVAYKGRKILGTRTMKTAQKPVRVLVTPERKNLPANREVVFCEVDLVDAAGVRDPWATDKVAFRVEGPAELLSVSNGDACEHASFVSFDGYPLYYGKACVTLRRKAGARGAVRLIATCGELAPAVVDFPSEEASWQSVDVTFRAKAGGEPLARRTLALTEQADGVKRLVLPRAEIPKGTMRVEVSAPFLSALQGEDGFWVLPDGRYGTYRLDSGTCAIAARRAPLPIFGMRTPRGTCLGIVRGERLDFSAEVAANAGAYALTSVFSFNDAGGRAYEDISIDFIALPDSEATYAGMARRYRADQLARGVVKPLAERVKNNDVLRYTAESVFVRVKHGYKCLNTEKKVEHQSPSNEPPVRCVISFARFKDIMRRMKDAGVAKAEVCSVGGTAGGFDGRFPDILPIPEEFGGEAQLRDAIAFGKSLGYQMTVHFCVTAMFECSRQWNTDDLCLRRDGSLLTSGIVAGGRTHRLCPDVFLKKYMTRDWATFRDFGFRGTHHIDVVSCIPPYNCFNPKHPLDAAASADCFRRIGEYSRETFGGFGSEAGFDWMAPSLDFALYTSWYPGHKGREASPLVDRVVPLWQLVYHGIIVSNPFYATIDGYIDRVRERRDYSDDAARFGFLGDSATRVMKIAEFGGRPVFYYTLYDDVAPVARAARDYAARSHLQYQFMDDHRALAPDVFLTQYANGEVSVANYSPFPYTWRGETVAARQIKFFNVPR